MTQKQSKKREEELRKFYRISDLMGLLDSLTARGVKIFFYILLRKALPELWREWYEYLDGVNEKSDKARSYLNYLEEKYDSQ